MARIRNACGAGRRSGDAARTRAGARSRARTRATANRSPRDPLLKDALFVARAIRKVRARRVTGPGGIARPQVSHYRLVARRRRLGREDVARNRQVKRLVMPCPDTRHRWLGPRRKGRNHEQQQADGWKTRHHERGRKLSGGKAISDFPGLSQRPGCCRQLAATPPGRRRAVRSTTRSGRRKRAGDCTIRRASSRRHCRCCSDGQSRWPR